MQGDRATWGAAWRLPLLALMLNCLWLGPALGSFELIREDDSPNGGVRYDVRYRLDQARHRAAINSLPSDQWAQLLTESCLLHVRSGDASGYDWGVKIDPEAHRAGGISCRAVRLGSTEAVQVTVDPTEALPLTELERGSGEIHLVVTGTPGESRREAIPDSHCSSSGPAWLRGLFLNPPDSGSLRGNSGWGSASAPQPALPGPPGAVRVAYREGEEVLRLVLADLPAGLGSSEQMVLSHHGDVLPSIERTAEALLFYAPRRHTLTDIHDAVFLTAGAVSPSPLITIRAAFDQLSPAKAEHSISRTWHFEQDDRYERFMNRPAGERFSWYRVQNPAGSIWPDTWTVELPVHDRLADAMVELEILLYGTNQTDGVSPDHQAEISLDGALMGEWSWEGQSDQLIHLTYDRASLGPGVIGLTYHVPPLDDSIDIQGLDSVTATWTGYPRLDPAGISKVELSPDSQGQPRLVSVAGLPAEASSEDFIVLDVSVPASPLLLSGLSIADAGDGSALIEFEAPPEACRFLVQARAGLHEPDDIAPSRPLPQVPSDVALEGIYVRSEDMAQALSPLLQHRGPGYIELDPQAAYDAYNGGQQNPEAIREALRALIRSAPEAVSFPTVVLIGHGSFDRRDYMGLQQGPQIPPFVELGTPTNEGTLEHSIDLTYALLFGEDHLPDAAVARIPAWNAGQLETIVERILGFEQTAGALSGTVRPGLFVFDDNEAAFQTDGLAAARQWESRGLLTRLHSLSWESAESVTEGIERSLESGDGGVSLAVYSGHGSHRGWAGEFVLKPEFLPRMNTVGKWPFVASFNCLNHLYAFPGKYDDPCMGEAWLLERPGGALASLGPCGLEPYAFQTPLIESFVASAAESGEGRPRTVGELALRCQVEYAVRFPALNKVLDSYLLFGDPASPWVPGRTLPTRSLSKWAVR